jgi:16S rRNA (cytosine967-C5)-methyltransferase
VCAFAVVRRVFERGAYADRALATEARSLEPRDRRLATQLAYGVVQRARTLDHLTEMLSGRPTAKLEPAVLASIRLGLYQLLFLDGIPAHAAVNESVSLVRGTGSAAGGLVNAVLRRAARENGELLRELTDRTPAQAAILHSVPDWLAEQWWRELGPEHARALLARVNQPAESALRVNTLRSTPEEVIATLPVPARAAADIPEGLVLKGPFDLESSQLWSNGAVMAQSRASMLVGRVLAPQPGERVLDLCAAPGAKATHIAALMQGQGEVIAVEKNLRRAQALSRTCDRMLAGSVQVQVADATRVRVRRRFDRVLVDPPCSGLGTLQSRPDIRWRASPQSIVEVSELQRRVLERGAQATSPSGVLVYSVCTISRAESEELIERFLADHDEFVAERIEQGPRPGRSSVQLLPHIDATDGFFIARLRRA